MRAPPFRGRDDGVNGSLADPDLDRDLRERLAGSVQLHDPGLVTRSGLGRSAQHLTVAEAAFNLSAATLYETNAGASSRRNGIGLIIGLH